MSTASLSVYTDLFLNAEYRRYDFSETVDETSNRDESQVGRVNVHSSGPGAVPTPQLMGHMSPKPTNSSFNVLQGINAANRMNIPSRMNDTPNGIPIMPQAPNNNLRPAIPFGVPPQMPGMTRTAPGMPQPAPTVFNVPNMSQLNMPQPVPNVYGMPHPGRQPMNMPQAEYDNLSMPQPRSQTPQPRTGTPQPRNRTPQPRSSSMPQPFGIPSQILEPEATTGMTYRQFKNTVAASSGMGLYTDVSGNGPPGNGPGMMSGEAFNARPETRTFPPRAGSPYSPRPMRYRA